MTQRFARRAVVWVALACVGLVSCSGGLKNGYFVKGWLKYRVTELDPTKWIEISSHGNDLAWLNPSTGHVLATNATCEDHGDPGLDVLTTHLLFGFNDRELKSRQTRMIDGREGMVSTYTAKLDGAAVDIEVAVLKKNHCVHDFVYISPVGKAEDYRADFERLLSEFTAEKS